MTEKSRAADIDWMDVLAEMRRAVSMGADRVELDVENRVVRGNKDICTSTPNDRETR